MNCIIYDVLLNSFKYVRIKNNYIVLLIIDEYVCKSENTSKME